MKGVGSAVLGGILLLALWVGSGSVYVIPETQQVIITEFGKPVGEPIAKAGLRFKIPLIQTVNRIEKRVLEWDGPSNEMATRDKLYISVDTFARWQIGDPLRYFLRLRDERSAISRLDDILGGETRNTVARHDLVELIRTTKGRQPQRETGSAAAATGPATNLPEIQFGRVVLEREIFEAAKGKLAEFGIELLDVRCKRINYNAAVANKIYDRMTSERRQIAERFRSEGAGEAAKIMGQKERDLRAIESEAYRQMQAIMGKADGEATAIYASAYNRSPEAREFYAFLRSLDTYRGAFAAGTTAVFSSEAELLRYFVGPGGGPAGRSIGEPVNR